MTSESSKAIPHMLPPWGGGEDGGRGKESELQSFHPNELLRTGADCETVDWQVTIISTSIPQQRQDSGERLDQSLKKNPRFLLISEEKAS